MKKIIKTFIFIAVISAIVVFRESITEFIVRNFIYPQNVEISEDPINQKNNDYLVLKTTDDFIIKNQIQILDVVYTILNNGWNSFSFYCDYDYPNCIQEVKAVFNDNIILSSINTAIHPFNSYRNIQLQISSQNKLTFMVSKLYSQEKIDILNSKVDAIYNDVVEEEMSAKEKIKAIHDYIVNHTYYDQNYKKDLDDSNNAYGALIKGKAICSGYTDAMQLFLIKMGITNYKLTSEDHIWNYVYLDNNWYHLDVSWDDPVTNNGRDMLIHDYFLINDETLKAKKDGEHNYNNMFLIEKES